MGLDAFTTAAKSCPAAAPEAGEFAAAEDGAEGAVALAGAALDFGAEASDSDFFWQPDAAKKSNAMDAQIADIFCTGFDVDTIPPRNMTRRSR
jgi:hypothetical protein